MEQIHNGPVLTTACVVELLLRIVDKLATEPISTEEKETLVVSAIAGGQ